MEYTGVAAYITVKMRFNYTKQYIFRFRFIGFGVCRLLCTLYLYVYLVYIVLAGRACVVRYRVDKGEPVRVSGKSEKVYSRYEDCEDCRKCEKRS